MDNCFVVTAPGLETFAAAEMRAIGLQPSDPLGQNPVPGGLSDEAGGVPFTGALEDIQRANLLLRTASRVLVRLGEFNAVGFDELRKKAGRLNWERYFFPNQPVNLRVTCHKSRLYHSDAVAERVKAAIGDRLGKMIAGKAPGRLGKDLPALTVVVRFTFDHCVISVDSSGELLHRRGYRLETAKAPLRETLAAGLILASGWDAGSPLLDPFCGSGTIPIEAALMALKVPPGANRKFAFMYWPGFDLNRWEALKSKILAQAANTAPSIAGSDRDQGAVQSARANAQRAGVAAHARFEPRAVSSIEPPPGKGWVVTNPPYGLRVSADKDLRNLYARFGAVLRERCPGWQVTLLCNDLKLLGQIDFPLDTSLSTVNGGVSVRIARGVVPG